MNTKTKIYFTYIIVITIIGLLIVVSLIIEVNNDREEIKSNPPVTYDFGAVAIWYISFESPDHIYWGIGSVGSIESNNTHTWETVTLDLTYTNSSYEILGKDKFSFTIKDTGNYTINVEWNYYGEKLEGNTSYNGGKISGHTDTTKGKFVECTTPICELDIMADKTFKFYIDIPTPRIVDYLKYNEALQKNSEQFIAIGIGAVFLWMISAILPMGRLKNK